MRLLDGWLSRLLMAPGWVKVPVLSSKNFRNTVSLIPQPTQIVLTQLPVGDEQR